MLILTIKNRMGSRKSRGQKMNIIFCVLSVPFSSIPQFQHWLFKEVLQFTGKLLHACLRGTTTGVLETPQLGNPGMGATHTPWVKTLKTKTGYLSQDARRTKSGAFVVR